MKKFIFMSRRVGIVLVVLALVGGYIFSSAFVSAVSVDTNVSTGMAPLVQTLPAVSITENSARLTGRLNPNGSLTNYWFEYGKTSSMNLSTAHTSAGSGTISINATFHITNLSSNTNYYYRLVAQNSYDTSYGKIGVFTTTAGSCGLPTVVTKPATSIVQNRATLNGLVNPNNSSTNYWFEYGRTTSLGSLTTHQSAGYGTSNINASKYIYNLSNDTTYYFRVVAENCSGVSRGAILNFTTTSYVPPTGSAPTVVTRPATSIDQNNATLNGYVNANNEATSYRFEYGRTTSLGSSTIYQSAGSGASNINVSKYISNLSENTTYYFRVVAYNSYGISYGSILSFTTTNDTPNGNAPTVVTRPATSIDQNIATLNGRVNPNNSATSYWFEYGKTTSLGNVTLRHSAGSGSLNVNISQYISNLSDDTTYYFRVVSHNMYGTSRGSILSFTTTNDTPNGNAPTVVTRPATSIDQNIATLNGRVNPNNDATRYWFEYGITSSLGSITTHQPIGSGDSNVSLFREITGIAQNTTYYFRIVANNSHGISRGSILSFTTTNDTPNGNAPTVVTRPATSIDQNNATLNGYVNPNNAVTNYWFEYGQTSSFGNSTTHQYVGSGSSNVNISQYISNLSNNTTYYFRVVAQNSHGISRGSILSFTTTNDTPNGNAPIVSTNSATSIDQNNATLNGYVNPNNALTNYWFEYGQTSSLGNSTIYQSAGSGSSNVNISQYISNLSNNTTYYFRVVAQNSHGITNGSILSFVTSGTVIDGSAPQVTTNSATGIYTNSATLNGYVNPNNAFTNYWFEYGTDYNFTNTSSYQSAGSGSGSITGSYRIFGLSNDTTYYFRIVAQNSYGTTYGSRLSFITNSLGYNNAPLASTLDPSNIGLTYATFYGTVNPNGGDTSAWFEYGTSYNSLYYNTASENMGSATYSRQISKYVDNLSKGVTYYYRVVARNNSGTSYGTVRQFTTSGNDYGDQKPSVTTNNATYVYQNSALLNGGINPNGGLSTAWFEYGPTTSFGFTTNHQPVGSGNTTSSYSYAISGLLPNTTYYFRAVGENNMGTAYGSIYSIRTAAAYVPPIYPPIYPPIINPTGLSCLILVPALNVNKLQPGEDFTYTITYKNGCNYDLSNAFLKVILPTDVTFKTTNYPFFNRDANGISYNLGYIPVGAQSAISISGRANPELNNGDTLIFSSVLNFNDHNGVFQSVSAYLSAVIGFGNAFGANILQAFGNLFGNCLFILLFVLLIIFLLWWLFFKRDNDKKERVDVLKE